ncbi:MAG TPA: hypothetical protein VFS22_04165 [Flavisolibacter sp.]|nr:hypothetical protein [Flavisolibacter sp.]
MATVSNLYNEFNSVLSLQPLVMVLKKMIAEGKPGAKRLYQGLLEEIEAVPQLLHPIEDASILQKHGTLIETLLSTIFPPSSTSNQGIYAICFPFQAETIYASPAFKDLFLKGGSNAISIPDHKTNINIAKANMSLAYNIILSKFYSLPVPITATSVHPFTDGDSGLTKYYELNLNAEFVDVKCINNDYAMPAGFSPNRTIETEELRELFPLENFLFEGLMVIDVTDVTQEQVITEIKNSLLNINAFSDVEVYDELQQHVQSLVGLRNIRIGITPFFKKNDYYLYTEAHYRNSILFKNEVVINNKDGISNQCQETFRFSNQSILYEILNESSSRFNELLKYYYEQGIKSLILCPLKCEDGELIGLLEIASDTKGRLQFHHLTEIQPAIQLFALALEKTAESLEMQIDKTIKEHFTAIQPAVEWRFTEAAFNYLQHQQISELARMPAISFEDVYPLYGSIDVRNSSTERSWSIQQDLLEQLNMAREVLGKADKIMDFPLLKEIRFRIDKYITSASDALVSDDEMMIYDFLQDDLTSLFENLRITKPELKKTIDAYFAALDPQRKVIYNQRKAYEESITRINDVLDRFMDSEQQSAQEVYPHYFERYVTDGIEFNIYIGQSISPQKPFNEMYVSNLKLWQLSLLAKAARLTNALEKRLSLPLQTTQLILAHSIPLTISFRRKERKFDVDGAYNIRYEIVKKRIDKVHVKDSEERLTQPGKIGIVYSQQKELSEYLEYIEFLQKEGLLGENIEHLELEDTQGISGLKAIRVDVNLSSENADEPKAETAKLREKETVKK